MAGKFLYLQAISNKSSNFHLVCLLEKKMNDYAFIEMPKIKKTLTCTQTSGVIA